MAVAEPRHVGEHQRGARLPGHYPERVEVGYEHEVAVPGLPRGELVTVHGVHVRVDGQQVGARLSAVRHHLVEEVPGVEPIALQPALHVGQGDDDRVDVARGDRYPELL